MNERIDVMKLLNECKALDEWKTVYTETSSVELFFVHEKLETERRTDTRRTDVTVYVTHGGKKGDSSFTVYASMSEDDVKEKIEGACRRALLVSNEPYELPGKGECKKELPGNVAGFDARDLAFRIARAAFAAPKPEGASINAFEVFVYKTLRCVRNSNGVDKEETVCSAKIEAIPTFTLGKDSVEIYEDQRFTVFDEEKLKKTVSERLFEARDRFYAVKPESGMTIDVLLRENEIIELMYELSEDLNYASAYMHANLHGVGDDLQSGGCAHDPLTVMKKSMIPGSAFSSHFDNDGSSLLDVTLIENGKVKNLYGSMRFGQYLGVKEPTGSLPCTKVLPGTLSQEELQNASYLDCAALSGLQIDLYNDYIGGEIRLAYLHEGKTVRPVTGISMSGRLSEALENLRMSAQTATLGSFEGPRRILLKNMTVL